MIEKVAVKDEHALTHRLREIHNDVMIPDSQSPASASETPISPQINLATGRGLAPRVRFELATLRLTGSISAPFPASQGGCGRESRPQRSVPAHEFTEIYVDVECFRISGRAGGYCGTLDALLCRDSRRTASSHGRDEHRAGRISRTPCEPGH